MNKVKIILLSISFIFFTGCVNNATPRLSHINQIDYPDGISVIIHNKDLRDDLRIFNSRLVNSKYKKQLQFVLDNSSSDIYNIIIEHEWTNTRGVIVNNHMLKNRFILPANSSKRIILNAPNFKAKNVLLNISCAKNCIKEK